MSPKTVSVASKPQHVVALRSTWRKTSEHYIAQAKRFLLVFLGAIVPQLLTNGFDNIGIDSIRALAPAALLVAIRQLYPELGAAGLDSAPGATIVPAEVAPPLTSNDGGHADAGGLLYLAIGLVVLLVILRVFHLI